MAGTKSSKLEDQAATAALYVTKKNKADQSKDTYPLGEDNKLSSASAATSLKYAAPRDLPSFPVTGLEHGEAGAGAAASLANANHKDFEHWKPGASAPASRAAMAAKDYKPAPLWHPEESSAGSKAAHIAVRDGGHVNVWLPEATSAGSSAAGQAFRAKGLSPQVFGGATDDDNKKALMAATGAMSGGRRRAGSSPVVLPPAYPDAANSAANALKAATSVSRSAARGSQTKSPPPVSSPINAARIHNAAVTNLTREMYTANPPVAPEVEERKRQQGLRAAAVSMAKQMYDTQQKAIDDAANDGKGDSHYAAISVQNRRSPSVASSDEPSAPQYVNLQEAAQKLAAERLAKLHDEHAAYRNYYGATQPAQKRLSIRGRPRRRASSDGSTPQGDGERSKMIRNQMSLFKDEVAQVDAKKRQRDRDALLEAAKRNVRANMTGMDERVFNETGKASPAMVEDWEAKATARAKADSDARMVNHGRVNIGGGKYLDQSEVDAIAAGRVQPTLDEITLKAEKQRARDEELRQQQEEREQEEKADARAKKEEEKAKKAEEKRLREHERQKSRVPKAEGLAAEDEKERPTTASEPPVLDPIPSVEPIDAEDEELRRPLRTNLTEEVKLQAEEEKRASTLAEEKRKPALGEEMGVAPLSGSTESSEAETTSKPVAATEDPFPKSEASTSANIESAPTTKPAEPLDRRIMPSAATTETTVTGPAPQKQPRGEGKVSSWLKSKLRRSSKPAKPESSKVETVESASTEKGFVGGANLTAATSTGKSSTEPSKDGSVREVALVGKPSSLNAPVTTPAAFTSPTEVTPGATTLPADFDNEEDDNDLYAASTQEPKSKQPEQRSRSSSPVSSLSSDEGEHPRGRSQLRREVTGSDENDGEQEFEEARDHFETEQLAPPAPLKDTMGRGSDSPVRDSKFSEDL
ncbi:MAG: hypothetical protein Q9216_000926 [Gyalolechia sp. 2 TL-2023]